MSATQGISSPGVQAFYRNAMRVLDEAGVPFLLGGTYALMRVAGIERMTKDLDVFLMPADRDRALAALEAAGFRTEIPYPHWLAKAYQGEGDRKQFLDLIYNSGNGVAEVDEEWFAHAPQAEVLGLQVKLTPPEESLWARAFVMERERFDGADIAHLIRAVGPRLDWDRLLRRFGPHWRVLLAHLVLYGFIYPSRRDRVPARILRTLIDRLRTEIDQPAPDDPICQGTLLSREQYLFDLEDDRLQDARIEPHGKMTAEDVALWTEAIEKD